MDTISGTVPRQVGLLSKLETFSVQNNDLTGTLHTQYGLLTNLRTLDLQYLHLSGTIPSTLGLLSSLTSLYLQWNDITSTIPMEVCSLRKQELDNFVVSCPTQRGRGVGNYSRSMLDLISNDGNCFSSCVGDL